jgi:hypothetical protein
MVFCGSQFDADVNFGDISGSDFGSGILSMYRYVVDSKLHLYLSSDKSLSTKSYRYLPGA